MGTRQLAAYAAKLGNSGLDKPFILATTPPTSGVGGSFAGKATVGSQLIDSAGKHYMCTAATGGASPSCTWTLTGSQV